MAALSDIGGAKSNQSAQNGQSCAGPNNGPPSLWPSDARAGRGLVQLHAMCRYDIARQLLKHSALAITEIAETLGYEEIAVYSRAFRRWSGTTPTRWREQHRRG